MKFVGDGRVLILRKRPEYYVKRFRPTYGLFLMDVYDCVVGLDGQSVRDVLRWRSAGRHFDGFFFASLTKLFN